MEILEVKNSHELNDFVAGQPMSQFLQSGEWADFQESLGRKSWRFLVKDDGKIIASAVIVKYPLPFGQSYLYCPRGPIFIKNIPAILFNKLKELAKIEKAAFLKIEPRAEVGDLKKIGFKEAAPVQPKNTLVLDLKKSEVDLLNSFHPKTRYNIRLAEKKGVKIRVSTDKKDVEHFWQLIQQTAKRDNFSPHPKEYYSALVEKLGQAEMLKMFIAEYENKILAINLVIFFGNTAPYLHGASADESRNLMAPHLLQWVAIKEAKNRNCLWYDFWGVAPLNQPEHPWVGVTRFKEGFNGQRIDYVGTWDLPVKRFWYKLYKAIKKFK